MKKIFLLLFTFIIIFLVSCDKKPEQPQSTEANQYTLRLIYDEILPLQEEFLIQLDEKTSITRSLVNSFIVEQEDFEVEDFYLDEGYNIAAKFPFELTSNINLYVKFNDVAVYHEVKLNTKGGVEINSLRIKDNKKIEELPTPTRENFDFMGWYTDSKCTTEFNIDQAITSDITLYAKWEKSNYTLTYYIDDEANTVEVRKNTTLENLPIPENEGYEFVGWYTDSKLKNAVASDFIMNKNVTLYTKWETKKFNVKFVNGDNVLETQRIETNKLASKPGKFNVEAVFNGWYSDANFEELFDFNTPIIKDTIIYGKYDNVARVEIIDGRNYQTLEEYTVSYNSKIALTNPIKQNYNFVGWYKDKYYRIPFDQNENVIDNLKIYAKFDTTTSYNEAYVYQNSAGGVVEGKIVDFNQYLNTDAYITVSTAKEFLDALKLAKYEYTNDSVTNGIVNQTLVSEGTIHVIEITNDLDLGYNVLKNSNCDMSLVTDHANFGSYYGSAVDLKSRMYVYSDIYKSGISQITLSNMYNLLIYSKNNSKITHAGFKINSSNNVVFRNLTMDEIWVWEDSPSASPNKKIGDYDCWGWAYFKINFSESIWIDNCTFGKSFDGQIDVSNTTFNTTKTYIRAPYFPTYDSGVHISNCDFNSGSDDSNGYIVKMMNEIEAEYLLYKADKTRVNNNTCLYYFNLRELGATYEQLLYGVAIPQKKGFLLGDTGNSGGGEKFLTTDKKFEAGKRYFRINGYEADGRTKYAVFTNYTVGDLISEYTYTINNQELHSVFEEIIPGSDYYNNLNLKVSFSNCRFINIEDRLPNVRGGIAYFYNCIVDTTVYLTYRAQLSAYQNSIKEKSDKYKLALVSQALIACLGGDVYSDTVIYKNLGSELVKNNNPLFSGDNSVYDMSGYSLQNCLYLPAGGAAKYGSMSYDGTTNPFETTDGSLLSIKNFSFRNENNEIPFFLFRALEINQSNYESSYQVLNVFITNSRSYLKSTDNYWLISNYTKML